VICREVAFRHGRCRIDIAPDPDAAGEPRFLATMFLIDADRGCLRPLLFDVGIRAVLRAPGEALALRLALAYLETRFGLFLTSVPTDPLGDVAGDLGDPIVIERLERGGTSGTRSI
jgi:hypothetical protein